MNFEFGVNCMGGEESLSRTPGGMQLLERYIRACGLMTCRFLVDYLGWEVPQTG